MNNATDLAPWQLVALTKVAGCLIPGCTPELAPDRLHDYDGLLVLASRAVGADRPLLDATIATLPSPISLASLAALERDDPAGFEILSSVVAGAYYMNLDVLRELGYHTGPRHRAPFELAVDELGGGILDPVLERGSFVRMP